MINSVFDFLPLGGLYLPLEHFEVILGRKSFLLYERHVLFDHICSANNSSKISGDNANKVAQLSVNFFHLIVDSFYPLSELFLVAVSVKIVHQQFIRRDIGHIFGLQLYFVISAALVDLLNV